MRMANIFSKKKEMLDPFVPSPHYTIVDASIPPTPKIERPPLQAKCRIDPESIPEVFIIRHPDYITCPHCGAMVAIPRSPLCPRCRAGDYSDQWLNRQREFSEA